MRRPRVAVLYVHPLFGQGIAQLLLADKELEVICLSASLGEAPAQLKRLRPHAIVVEGCEEGDSLRDLVQDLPPAVFIRVHLEDNVMDVYQSRQILTARPENLVEAIYLGFKRRGHAQVSLSLTKPEP